MARGDFSSLGTNMSAQRVRNWMLSLPDYVRADIRRVLVREGNRLASAQRSRARSRRIAASFKVTEGRTETGYVRQDMQGRSVADTASGFKAVRHEIAGRSTLAATSVGSAVTGRFVNDLVVSVSAGGATTTKSVSRGQSSFYDFSLAHELGTRRMPRIPFFYTTWRSMRGSIQQTIERAMYDAVVFGGNRSMTFI